MQSTTQNGAMTMTREDLLQQQKRANDVLRSGKGPQKYAAKRLAEIKAELAKLDKQH